MENFKRRDFNQLRWNTPWEEERQRSVDRNYSVRPTGREGKMSFKMPHLLRLQIFNNTKITIVSRYNTRVMNWSWTQKLIKVWGTSNIKLSCSGKMPRQAGRYRKVLRVSSVKRADLKYTQDRYYQTSFLQANQCFVLNAFSSNPRLSSRVGIERRPEWPRSTAGHPCLVTTSCCCPF